MATCWVNLRSAALKKSPAPIGCRRLILIRKRVRPGAGLRQHIAADCARFSSSLGERNDRLTNTKRYGLFHCHRQVPVVGGIPVALIRLTCPGAMSSGAGNLRSVRQDQRYIRPQPVPGELRLTYQFDPCRCNSDLFKLYGVLAF